jgi:hypothetical protein
MSVDETLLERRQIVKFEDDDGGSRITLACGHVIWAAIEPVYQGGSMYCAECLHTLLEQVRKTQRRA